MDLSIRSYDVRRCTTWLLPLLASSLLSSGCGGHMSGGMPSGRDAAEGVDGGEDAPVSDAGRQPDAATLDAATPDASTSDASAPDSGTAGATTANLWVDTDGGSCTRSATPTAYDTATACATIDAAWTAAQGGDLIIVKGGTYASPFSASGGKSSMVTIQAAVGENPWFTGAGSLSSVSNMTVTDERPFHPWTKTGLAAGLTMQVVSIGGTGSANIHFHNIDIWCQNQSPWAQVTGDEGTMCTSSILISHVNGFTMTNGAIGPVATCYDPSGICDMSQLHGHSAVSKITGCGAGSNCTHITFDNVWWHDNHVLDIAPCTPNCAHNELLKIDIGQHISFIRNRWTCVASDPESCNSAYIFFGDDLNPATETANFITFEGNVADPGGHNSAVSYGYCQLGTPPNCDYSPTIDIVVQY